MMIRTVAALPLSTDLAASESLLNGPAQDPVQKKILLFEGESCSRVREGLLAIGSRHPVSIAKSYLDVLKLGWDGEIAFAILSDTCGLAVFQAVAQCVRAQWPFARILIVRGAASSLEDYLYDEAIDQGFRLGELHEALLKLSRNPWNRKPTIINPVPPESDPSKASPRGFAQEGTSRGVPAGERHTSGRRSRHDPQIVL
jgi:hypothetical protein